MLLVFDSYPKQSIPAVALVFPQAVLNLPVYPFATACLGSNQDYGNGAIFDQFSQPSFD